MSTSCPDLAESCVAVLERLRAQRPLVLSLTNEVVQTRTADWLLAIGAVPAMLCDGGEAEEMVAACTNALLINVGTLSTAQADAMRRAVAAARAQRIPWVLDPVAVGLLSLRAQLCRELLPAAPTIIRGNASEIAALAGLNAGGRGPESTLETEAAQEAARYLARKTGAAVLVTGARDFITDGAEELSCANGHPMLTLVTGAGCAMGALAAACAAVEARPLYAATACAVLMGLIGERAAAGAAGPGSFAAAWADGAYSLCPEDVRRGAKLTRLR
ncbi:MAG: hydroxyethylthiazole kinase [Akkermansia sp.]